MNCRADRIGTDHRAVRGLRERGATFVEYALLVALICAASIAGIARMEDGTRNKVDTVSTNVGSLPPVQGSIPPVTP